MITKSFLILIKIVCFFYTNYEKSIIFAGKIKQKRLYMNKMTTFATVKPSELKQNPFIIHSGLAKLIWQRIDIQVPESKIIKNGVAIFKD